MEGDKRRRLREGLLDKDQYGERSLGVFSPNRSPDGLGHLHRRDRRGSGGDWICESPLQHQTIAVPELMNPLIFQRT